MTTATETAIRSDAPAYSAQPADPSHIRNAESGRCIAVRQADGTLTVLNWRFGQDPAHRLLEHVGPGLANAAAALVRAQDEARYRKAAARLAAVNKHPMAKMLARDCQDADERLWMAADVCRVRLDLADSWGVVVIDGHAISHRPDGKGIDCVRLDGRCPCEGCDGCGSKLDPNLGPDYCGQCKGSGVSPTPAYLPACLREAVEAHAAAPSWLDVPMPAADRVDPAHQKLVDDFAFPAF